ncbi:MAG: YheC/YheD family protein [Alicyclobacillaceae bacterium]|nr:YheC/YheD family protein [Alicyclobacillaceae bacterium]
MALTGMGELVWYRQGDRIRLGVWATSRVRAALTAEAADDQVQVSNLRLPWVGQEPRSRGLYRHPIRLWNNQTRVAGGPVFAILAGSRAGDPQFCGCRGDFRDLLQVARESHAFLYVLPAASVGPAEEWTGWVRLRFRRWRILPCPHPEAVYNRVPTRSMERTAAVVLAKQTLHQLHIPLFNPEYFNKLVMYQVVVDGGLGHYVPETMPLRSRRRLEDMIARHGAVYLKPAGGSIGHGIFRIDAAAGRYRMAVLKHGRCQAYDCHDLQAVWRLFTRERLQGGYVVQAAKSLIRWQGRPCDFRVLLQKAHQRWHVVGKGVRVAGPGSITTHVPNGGFIMDTATVLERAFGSRAGEVERDLDHMALECAEVIDAHYQYQLGEMSMDVGLDPAGRLWFLEANAKPMKFDEPDIRERSLAGVLRCLEELRQPQAVWMDE